MDYIIKRASTLTTSEQLSRGVYGIPADWPVESAIYTGSVPSDFELITDTDLSALYAANQTAYDAWIVSNTQTVAPRGSTLVATFADPGSGIKNKFLSTENGTSDSVPAVASSNTTLTLLTYSGSNAAPSGTLELRINTTTGTAAASITLAGTQTQVASLDLDLVQGDAINCKVVSGATGVDKPLVKLYSTGH